MTPGMKIALQPVRTPWRNWWDCANLAVIPAFFWFAACPTLRLFE